MKLNKQANPRAAASAAAIVIEVLHDPAAPQLLALQNGYKQAIGEAPLTEEQQRRLRQAIAAGRITFFVARCGERLVGMCSVARCYSTFACSDTGVYEDFYVEPAFRGSGLARRLAKAAQSWCCDNGIASLTVCCAPCDEKMYQSLGFSLPLGSTFAHVN